MTDLIHEKPKKPEDTPASAQDEQPMDEQTGQKRVYGYIFILFVVAFALLVWSFLMNQRGTDQVLSELRGNADALQATLTRNVELERQADELEERLDALTEEKEALKEALVENEAKQQEEIDRLTEEAGRYCVHRDLCHALLLMNDGEDEAAAQLLSSYGTADYEDAIAANDGGEAPVQLRARYEAMLEQLVMEGYLTVAEDGSLKYWHVDAP
ncbi:MAG: DUF4164 domain-containing protein [Oscillospiraceae bacterium]|nr:DUF4164 domain-containing protein [Oscillospiraceae bacterium]